MPFVALEFDHQIAQPAIRWIVVECAGVGRKCGGPIALSPRHDVAYFLDDTTAERDAQRFASYKNATAQAGVSSALDGSISEKINSGTPPRFHYAYAWDHLIFSPTLRWAVFQWSGSDEISAPRIDVAYFVDPRSAELDAKVFAFQRDPIYASLGN